MYQRNIILKLYNYMIYTLMWTTPATYAHPIISCGIPGSVKVIAFKVCTGLMYKCTSPPPFG